MEDSNSIYYQSRRENENKKQKKFGSVLEDESLKGKDGDGEVRKTAGIAEVNSSTTATAMDHMKHIVERHMKPLKSKGKSYFLSRNKEYICALVTETMERPDVILQHKNRRDRGVKKKTFLHQVGVHGINKEAPCFTVTVIFNIEEQIITAFPTL